MILADQCLGLRRPPFWEKSPKNLVFFLKTSLFVSSLYKAGHKRTLQFLTVFSVCTRMWPFVLLTTSFIILVEDLLSVRSTKLLDGPLMGGPKRAGVKIHRLKGPRDVEEELEVFLDESRRGFRGNILKPGAIRVPLFSSEVQTNSNTGIAKSEETGSMREKSLENLKSILSITDRLIRVLPFLLMYSYDFQPVLSILSIIARIIIAIALCLVSWNIKHLCFVTSFCLGRQLIH